MAQARTRCAGLSKTCQSLGHATEGHAYHLPQDGADELKTHLQNVVELTKRTRKTRQFSRPTTPASEPPSTSTTKTVNPSFNDLPQCKASDPSEINDTITKVSQNESNCTNISESDINMQSNDLDSASNPAFCIDIQPVTNLQSHISTLEKVPSLSDKSELHKIVSETDGSIVHESCNLNLPEEMLCTSSRLLELVEVVPPLRPYKSPLEHMKLRCG